MQDLHIFIPNLGIIMKTLLLMILFLFASSISVSLSQEKQLFGFSDLDWGSSREVVKEYMKDNFNLTPGYEKNDAIGYQGGHYFGQDLFLWVYFFGEKGLDQTDLVIKNNGRPLGAIFSEIVHKLTVGHGDPDLYQPDDWKAEWFYYDFPGKHLKATIKVSPWTDDKMSSIKITFLNSEYPE